MVLPCYLRIYMYLDIETVSFCQLKQIADRRGLKFEKRCLMLCQQKSSKYYYG